MFAEFFKSILHDPARSSSSCLLPGYRMQTFFDYT
jgi:hypothetical protein